MSSDLRVTNRDTTAEQNKGQSSTQSYLGKTSRTTTGIPSGFTDTKTQIGSAKSETTSIKNDVKETRTSTGVGKTSVSTDDRGIVVRFKVPLQGKQPVRRVTYVAP